MAVTASIKHKAADEILKGGKKDIGTVSPEGLLYMCPHAYLCV